MTSDKKRDYHPVSTPLHPPSFPVFSSSTGRSSQSPKPKAQSLLPLPATQKTATFSTAASARKIAPSSSI